MDSTPVQGEEQDRLLLHNDGNEVESGRPQVVNSRWRYWFWGAFALSLCLLAAVLIPGIIGYKKVTPGPAPPTPPPAPVPTPAPVAAPTFAPTTAAPQPVPIPEPTFNFAPTTQAPTAGFGTLGPTVAPTTLAPIPPTVAPTGAPTFAPTVAPPCEPLVQVLQPCFDTDTCRLYLRRADNIFATPNGFSLYGREPKAMTFGLPPNSETFQATPTIEAPVLLPEGTRVEDPPDNEVLSQFYLIEKVSANITTPGNLTFFGNASIRVRQNAQNPLNTLIGQPEMLLGMRLCYDYNRDGDWDWCQTCTVEVFVSLDPQHLECAFPGGTSATFFNKTVTLDEVEASTGVRPYTTDVECTNIGFYMWVVEHPNSNVGALLVSLGSNEAEAFYSRLLTYFDEPGCRQVLLPYRPLGTQVYLREATRFSTGDFDFPPSENITPSSTVPETMSLAPAAANTTQTRLIEVRRDVTDVFIDPRDQVVESRIEFVSRGANLTDDSNEAWARIDVQVDPTININRASIALQTEVDVDDDGEPEYCAKFVWNLLANLTVLPFAGDLEYRTYQLWPVVAYDQGTKGGDLTNVTLRVWVWVYSTTAQIGPMGTFLPPANISVIFDTPGDFSTQKEPLAAVFNPGWRIVDLAAAEVSKGDAKLFLVGDATPGQTNFAKRTLLNYTIGNLAPGNIPAYNSSTFEINLRTGVAMTCDPIIPGCTPASMFFYKWQEPRDACQYYGDSLIFLREGIGTTSHGGLRLGFPINGAGNFTNPIMENGLSLTSATPATLCAPRTGGDMIPQTDFFDNAFNMRAAILTFNFLEWVSTSQAGFPVPGSAFKAEGVSERYGFSVKVRRAPYPPGANITHLCGAIFSAVATAGTPCSGPNCGAATCPAVGTIVGDCFPNIQHRASFGCAYDLDSMAPGDTAILKCDHEEGASTVPPAIGSTGVKQDMFFGADVGLNTPAGVDPWLPQFVIWGCTGFAFAEEYATGIAGLGGLEPPPNIADAWYVSVNDPDSFVYPGVQVLEPNVAV